MPDRGGIGHALQLRADALRNRDRIVNAAARLFAEQGPSASLEDIAHCAGVSLATLYRRFPTRADLEIAVLEHNLLSHVDAVERALRKRRAGDAFDKLIFELASLQTSERTLRLLLKTGLAQTPLIEQRTTAILQNLGKLIAKAQREDALRPDLCVTDVLVTLLANAFLLEATRDTAPQVWRRYVALVVNGFHANHYRPLPPPTRMSELRHSISMSKDRGSPVHQQR